MVFFCYIIRKKMVIDNYKVCVYIVIVMWYGIFEICVEDLKWIDRDFVGRVFMG